MPIRNYEIVDEQGLLAAHPNLFKMVPDYRAIDNARKARFNLAPYVTDKKDAPAALPPPAPEPAPKDGVMPPASPVAEETLTAGELLNEDGGQIHLEEAIAATVSQNQEAASSTSPFDEDDETDLSQIPKWAQGGNDGQS